MVTIMPSTTPQNAPAIAKIFELKVSPTNQSPARARTKTGMAARWARPQGTLTRRLQPVHASVLVGRRVCFCQNEKVFRSHHGHAYIESLPEPAARTRLCRGYSIAAASPFSASQAGLKR